MTDQEINIAIADTCGNKNVHPVIIRNVTRQGDDRCCGVTSDDGWIPDYCHDLNAMHEVVFSMDQDNRTMWFNNLCDIVNRRKELALDAMSIFYLINSTAHHRAEAFLRTVGKWKE